MSCEFNLGMTYKYCVPTLCKVLDESEQYSMLQEAEKSSRIVSKMRFWIVAILVTSEWPTLFMRLAPLLE